ncbi:MAG: hypothetical protein ACPLKQ_05825 [Candidatus Bathyarchaeales archaeon]
MNRPAIGFVRFGAKKVKPNFDLCDKLGGAHFILFIVQQRFDSGILGQFIGKLF